CTGGRPGLTLADRVDVVQGGDFLCSRGDALAELERLEHFGVVPELEQLAERLLEAFEPDRVDAVALLQVARQVAEDGFARAHRHVDTRARRLEGPRPFIPEGSRGEVPPP